jgi:hypothetical protein
MTTRNPAIIADADLRWISAAVELDELLRQKDELLARRERLHRQRTELFRQIVDQARTFVDAVPRHS